jgi:hypothetical protein
VAAGIGADCLMIGAHSKRSVFDLGSAHKPSASARRLL